jgi:hypothetical protein
VVCAGQLAALADGCELGADVDDESPLPFVLLHAANIIPANAAAATTLRLRIWTPC